MTDPVARTYGLMQYLSTPHWAYRRYGTEVSLGAISPPPPPEPDIAYKGGWNGNYESDDVPILAHRLAKLVPPDQFERLGGLWRSLTTGGAFGVDTVAVCKRNRAHEAPVWGCSCGFYADPIGMPSAYCRSAAEVLLQVELSGKVIVHEKGYRAQHQRVLSCELNPCNKCLAAPPDVVYVDLGGGIRTVRCLTCALEEPSQLSRWVRYTMESITARIPVPVTCPIPGGSSERRQWPIEW